MPQSAMEKAIILFLRLALAWTFLYPAYRQVLTPDFNVAGFLSRTKTFHDVFSVLTGQPLASIVGAIVAYGHLLIGLSLLAGLIVRISAAFGALLMVTYWAAHMDWPYIENKTNMVVDFHLVYAAVLLLLIVKKAGHVWGLDAWAEATAFVRERPLVARLFSSTRKSAAAILLLTASASILISVPPAHASMELARQKNCLACHAIDKKLMGPAYKDVAAKYDGHKDAVDQLAAKVMKGGSGVWGRAAMPPGRVTADEATQLVQWILGQNRSPESPSTSRQAAASPPTATSPTVPPGSAERPPAEKAIRRGKYLVDSVLSCGNCHSPRTADNAVIEGRELSGGRTYDTPAFYVTPGNLTPDTETGLGAWSSDDIKRALTEGVRPNGLPLAPMMPVPFFKAMTGEDLDAVVGYLRSLAPARNPSPEPVYKKEFHAEVVPDAEKPFVAREIETDLLTRGRYLATLGHCLDCHTPAVNGTSDYERDAGRGGKRVGLNRLLVPNITPHPTAGLGAWTDAEIKKALTTGVRRDGYRLQYPMPWPYLATLEERDVDSLVAWLRSLPPKE